MDLRGSILLSNGSFDHKFRRW